MIKRENLLTILESHQILEMHFTKTTKESVLLHPQSGVGEGVRLCHSLLLRTIVFSPNVKHKYGGNKEQRHHQHWNWSNFDAGRIVGIESPHSSRSGSTGWSCFRRAISTACCLPLLDTAAGSGRTRRWQFTGRTWTASNRRRKNRTSHFF